MKERIKNPFSKKKRKDYCYFIFPTIGQEEAFNCFYLLRWHLVMITRQEISGKGGSRRESKIDWKSFGALIHFFSRHDNDRLSSSFKTPQWWTMHPMKEEKECYKPDDLESGSILCGYENTTKSEESLYKFGPFEQAAKEEFAIFREKARTLVYLQQYTSQRITKNKNGSTKVHIDEAKIKEQAAKSEEMLAASAGVWRMKVNLGLTLNRISLWHSWKNSLLMHPGALLCYDMPCRCDVRVQNGSPHQHGESERSMKGPTWFTSVCTLQILQRCIKMPLNLWAKETPELQSERYANQNVGRL